jgi:AraC-like DNA-binding protein
VSEIFADFPVSYRQLSRYLQAEYCAGPKELQQSARMAEVMRLLSETRWSVTTIALELGYSSAQHLASAFRRYAGMTPTEYRNHALDRLSATS